MDAVVTLGSVCTNTYETQNNNPYCFGDGSPASQRQSQTTRYFENTGDGSTTTFTERFGAANPVVAIRTRTMRFADLDGDGDLDGFLHSGRPGHQSGISYVRNFGVEQYCFGRGSFSIGQETALTWTFAEP